MDSVRDSAEHHFVEKVESLKADSAGWMAFRFGLSARREATDFLKGDGLDTLQKIESARRQALSFFDSVRDRTRDIKEGTLWLFADNDVVLIARPANAAEKQNLLRQFRDLSTQNTAKSIPCEILPSDLYVLQKIADEKLLSARRMDAYAAMADSPRVRSIATRRKRRGDPLVLIVEDDRFTASYTASILSRNYDLVHARTGEEAIIAHIEHAPDAVFLDIHLPGLSGHEVLQAIRKTDPHAFVVMLSVDSEKTGVLSASERGAGGFLKKPVSKDRLLAAVAKSPFIRRSGNVDLCERETTTP
ncbi:MAG: response regulator [Rhodospirillales bacterium]|nr:response regulator [Rhodospirillales bacterium]